HGEQKLAAEPARLLRFLNHARISQAHARRKAQVSKTRMLPVNRMVARLRYFGAHGETTKSPQFQRAKPSGDSGVETTTDMQAADPLGRVLSVTGSQAQVRLAVDADVRATVGKFLGIRAGDA